MPERPPCRATEFRVAFCFEVQIPDLDGPALSTAFKRTRLDAADHISDRLSRHPGHCAHHQGGAENFFTKPVSSEDLLPAIERALVRHQASREQQAKLDVVHARLATLTTRQRQVFDLIVVGNTNKHIARALGGTERTIKAHRQQVMEKLQVRTLADLVTLAERVGAVSATGSTSLTAPPSPPRKTFR